MNGIYVHIPFCKKRCIYCDFYSTTYGIEVRRQYVKALCREMQLRASFLEGPVDSVYLGGGTPSQLSSSELEEIFHSLNKYFQLKSDAEITIEVNPDDITPSYVDILKATPVNRLSMGVQTFDDATLRLLNRRHTAQEACRALETVFAKGYSNVSIDLIYGLPHQSLVQWEADLRTAFSFPVTHLSAYALIYEEGTKLWQMRKLKQVEEVGEELSLKMFNRLIDEADAHGFEHYEISNFARPAFRSRHNSGYWHQMHYLGLGTSAHSYDGSIRRWNNPDVQAYIQADGNVDKTGLFEQETLTMTDCFNEAVMTALRTSDGLDLNKFEKAFGLSNRQMLMQRARPYVEKNLLKLSQDNLALTRQGLFLSDGIMSDLMTVD